jgi:hypothetical protein
MKKMNNNGKIMMKIMIVMKMMINQIKKNKLFKRNLNLNKKPNKLNNNKFKKNKKKRKVVMMMKMKMMKMMIMKHNNFNNKFRSNKKYILMVQEKMITFKEKKRIFIFTLTKNNNKKLTELIVNYI